jgi:hypothetical protein
MQKSGLLSMSLNATTQFNELHASAEALPPLGHPKGFIMPLTRISLPHDAPTAVLRAISDTVYDAMIKVANVPEHDKFQIVSRHAADELIYPEDGFLGLRYTANIVFIQVTWNAGRTTSLPAWRR